MRFIIGLLIFILSIIFIVPVSFGLGFVMQLLLNPILAYFGLKAVSTTLCASLILLISLLKLIF